MNLLFLGDIVGKPGRLAVRALLPKLIHRAAGRFVIANCENVSGGAGVDPDSCRELFDAGVDVLTSGNHIWRKREIVDYLEREPRLLRPANFPPGAPGRGLALLSARRRRRRSRWSISSAACSWTRSIARSRPPTRILAALGGRAR